MLLKNFGKLAEAITKRVREDCAPQSEKLNIPMMYLKSSKVDKVALARRISLLRAHGLARKVPKENRYILTPKGRKVAAAILPPPAADTQQFMELAA